MKNSPSNVWRARWIVAASMVASLVQAQPKEALGQITTFAQVPAAPGYPEGIAVHGNTVFVSGPARFGTAGTGPSAIQVYNRKTGQLTQTITVQGEATQFEHALSNIAIDGEGDVYALSTQLGLIRFSKQGQQYVQHAFGNPLPDLPSYLNAEPGQSSSPTVIDFPPLPNDVVFDDLGNLYVTDSLQATIFRYAPGGGQPVIWFQSELLAGGGFIPFGPNGIRLDPTRQWIYFASTTSFLDANLGSIYRLPLVNQPTANDLQLVHQYTQGEAPDQLAFGAKRFLYVTLAFSNQISVIAPNGDEYRISSAPGDDIPLDAPAAIAFDSRTKSLLVANHALLTGDATHFAVLRVFVNDPGSELAAP